MSEIAKIVDRVKSGKSSAMEEVKAALRRAEDHEGYNIFINMTSERALGRAREIDKKLIKGEDVGALAGVPFAVKDNYLTFGAPTTAAAKMLESFDAPLQATAVEKLEAEGAICIGKTNLDAYAHGGSTENSYFGPTLNAVDKTRVAGGSSGGSAVAVALGIVPFALGSDTGGSIRQPASFNGVVGIKPTYGTVSRYGVVAMASSTDVMGCFTKEVADSELVMSIMAGHDERDGTTLPNSPLQVPYLQKGKMKVGIIKDCMGDGVDTEVKAATEQYVKKLTDAGHSVSEVSLPMYKYALAIYYIVVPAEVCSNLARYDGIRYGYRDGKTLSDVFGKSRDGGFMPENKRRIMIGNYVLSSGFFDAYYLQAQKARTLLINEYDKAFKDHDVLLSPVAPNPAFKLGENTADPLKMYLEDIMTVPPSLAGLPAFSVPAGKTKAGLPVGVQLIGKRKCDAQLFALAKEME
ncbi:MAG: Asp-tRNA(Asn)/Glu-tRNA(Gln) amidotransferase subunit GatA [Candidatus Nomurabacteria bacterium]|jgi:aspartyl-tRNA(Asn)/glutamyl-tRNA(Gln) amidotransferase subunit A|nr:Asp-tRNA(Asn)/Glu-tRNA(Gln) amidotransferase subunit GatA [Candidatus Nomurabacteria bacterium]